MDFVVGLPNSNGYTTILFVVDGLTKFAHFGALPNRFTIEFIAHFFYDIVVKIHRFPPSIISN